MVMGSTKGLFTHRQTDSSTSITWKDSFIPLTKLFSIRLPVFPIIGMAVLHSYIWFLKYWASKVLFNQYRKHYLVPRWWLLLFKTPCSQIWDNLESANIFHCKVDPSKDKSVRQYVSMSVTNKCLLSLSIPYSNCCCAKINITCWNWLHIHWTK